MSKFFAIQDDEGRYVNEYSIWKETDSRKWNYCSKENYYGMRLKNSIKECQEVINGLEGLLHRVGLQRTFSIKEVV